jgi:hypothetical protein
MARLIHPCASTAWKRDVSEPSPTLVAHLGTSDSACRHRADELLDVRAHEIQLVLVAAVGWMDGDLRWRQSKDQKAAADIDVGQSQYVA